MSAMDADDKVWVADAEVGWRLMRVKKSNGDSLIVAEQDGEGEYEVSIDVTESYDPSHDDTSLSDIYQMGDMNEAGLLHILRERALNDKIYTHIGDVLLSVNPYHNVEDDEFLHNVADRVYRDLLQNGFRGKSQSVLVNGESGAGKTEASKRVMAYLATASARRRKSIGAKKKPRSSFSVVGLFGKRGAPKLGRSSVTSSNGDAGAAAAQENATELETSIVETNPVLEAFGNAQTVRNDNSSRFGKFVRLDYDKDGVIVGARTLHFLLEKSRLTLHGVGERNYHIFYQLLAGSANGLLPEDLLPEDLAGLGDVAEYRYLSEQDPDESADGEEQVASSHSTKNRASVRQRDLQDFEHLLVSLDLLGFSSDEKAKMWKILVGILLLGNISFESNGPVGVKCVDVHPALPGLLGVHPDALKTALERRSVRAGRRTSVSIVPLSLPEAEASRDGLAKALYASLFDWLVERVNIATNLSVSHGGKDKSTLFIGILDVFGFEVLQTNSFEQLCINYANEKLQSMFDTCIFDLERATLQAEDVEPPALSFEDNADLIHLLDSRPNGLFQLLDEQGALGARGSDENFFLGLQSIYGESNSRLILSKFDQTFEIVHFAGPVKYEAPGLVSKNSDHLQPDLRSLIVDGKGHEDFARTLLKPNEAPHTRFKVTARSAAAAEAAGLDDGGPRNTRKMAKLESVSSFFRAQLAALSSILLSTDLHFVRCIKPNETKSLAQFHWDAPLVLAQLRALGVLQMIQVRRQGYPVRKDFEDILERYPYLLAAHGIEWKPGQNDRPSLVSLLTAVLGPDAKNDLFRMGSSKVFMLDDALKTLNHNSRVQREQGLTPEELLEQSLAAAAEQDPEAGEGEA
ncbi:Myosin-1 [Hondaea fermentalgiana]|uniref:Myosin-1 n=1 Tax=Hondaea fermentalgiana TaxID=2315210 RepID=A0A2R5G1U8_9STRA|nr:Myosin-1 [Hondaea fermentalgiana]|eukprot:GBG24980.1 Myosin-1 [Hondaea fermentalgiana]